MRFMAVAVLGMLSVSCMSTNGGRYEMRAAAFAVPTFEEDKEQGEDTSDDSASLMNSDENEDGLAGQRVYRARSGSQQTSSQSKSAS